MKQRPVLVTQRLVLRTLSEDDVDALVRTVIGDQQIMKSLLGDPSTPSKRRELALKWTRAWNQHWEQRGFGVWGIRLRAPESEGLEHLAGFCGFVMDSRGRGPELLYALARRGYEVTLSEARAELGGRVTQESALAGLVVGDQVWGLQGVQVGVVGPRALRQLEHGRQLG